MINDRQFVLSKNEYKSNNWTSVKMASGYYLSYEKHLNVIVNDAKTTALLGYAWQVDPSRISPEKIVKQSLGEDIQEIIQIEKTWCGRYVLISGEHVFLDATGLLGVFYDQNQVCSSLNVLCGIKGLKIQYPVIYHTVFPDFLPGTFTTYSDVKRLLPCQIYNYVTGEVTIRPLLPDGIAAYENDRYRIDAFIDYYTTALKNMAELFSGKELWLALTGGYDSRTALALLNKTSIEYKTYTLEHDNISSADIELPKLLSEKIGREWRYIKRNPLKYSPKRKRQYMIHSAGMAVDEDRLFWVYHQYQDLRKPGRDIVILQNSIWECVIEYFANKSGEPLSEDNISELFRWNNYIDLLDISTREWFEIIHNDTLNTEISVENRVLWDLRSGCWLSSVEQTFDMMDGIISIHPTNSRLFLSILMGFDLDMRKTKTHQVKIIENATPALNDIPFENELKNIKFQKIKVLKFIAGKYMWMARNIGIRNTLDYRKNRI